MNYYYLPDGPGWRVNDFYFDGPDYVVNIEKGYDGDTDFEDHRFEYAIETVEQAENAIKSLPEFLQSTGPITGGGFPPPK